MFRLVVVSSTLLALAFASPPGALLQLNASLGEGAQTNAMLDLHMMSPIPYFIGCYSEPSIPGWPTMSCDAKSPTLWLNCARLTGTHDEIVHECFTECRNLGYSQFNIHDSTACLCGASSNTPTSTPNYDQTTSCNNYMFFMIAHAPFLGKAHDGVFYKFLFNGCPRIIGETDATGSGLTMVHQSTTRSNCENLCSADSTCAGFEINGCSTAKDCDGICYHFPMPTSGKLEMINGNCVTTGDQQSFMKTQSLGTCVCDFPDMHCQNTPCEFANDCPSCGGLRMCMPDGNALPDECNGREDECFWEEECEVEEDWYYCKDGPGGTCKSFYHGCDHCGTDGFNALSDSLEKAEEYCMGQAANSAATVAQVFGEGTCGTCRWGPSKGNYFCSAWYTSGLANSGNTLVQCMKGCEADTECVAIYYGTHQGEGAGHCGFCKTGYSLSNLGDSYDLYAKEGCGAETTTMTSTWRPVADEHLVVTPAPTPTPAPAPPPAKAVGDPHLKNMKGEAFDVHQTGNMLMLEIPRTSTPHTLDFSIRADIERFGMAKCGPTYITSLYMHGKWLGERMGGVIVRAGFVADEGDSSTNAFGIRLDKQYHSQTDFALMNKEAGRDKFQLADDAFVWTQGSRKFLIKINALKLLISQPARTRGEFLDLQVKGIGKLDEEVGGLLGIDDHSEEESKPHECRPQGLRLKVKQQDADTDKEEDSNSHVQWGAHADKESYDNDPRFRDFEI